MSEQQLSELIHQTVGKVFNNNSEHYLETCDSLIAALPLSQKESLQDFKKSLFDYTLLVSNLTCAAMMETLSSVGILSIHSENN